MKFSAIIALLFFVTVQLSGQKDTLSLRIDSTGERVYVLQKVQRDGVTMPEVEIKGVTIVGRTRGAGSVRSQFRKYERLVYNIKKAYPYALIVREKLNEVNSNLTGMTSEKERKEYIKTVEKEVFGDYEDDMRDMTMTQGRILLKLIDRETQNTSFDLIKKYRGGLSAAFWQGIARIFGTNLKEEYDPYGNDFVLELIIQDIEAGLL